MAGLDFWDFDAQAPRSTRSDEETADLESSVRAVGWGNGVTSSGGNGSFPTPSSRDCPFPPARDRPSVAAPCVEPPARFCSHF